MMFMIQFVSLSRKGCFLLFFLLLAGCAGSPFSTYDRELKGVRNLAGHGNLPAAVKELKVFESGLNSELYLLEKGRINQALEDHGASKTSFESVIQSFQKHDDDAEFTLSAAVAQTGSLFINDAVIPYKAEPYERIFVYHYQALNYLLSGDISGAGVEIRRALYEQRLQELKYEEDLQNAQNDFDDSEGEFIGQDSLNDSLQQAYANMDQIGNLVNSSLVNPYLYFLSGLVQEVEGETSNALVSYKKAIHAAPQNRAIQKALMSIAFSMDDDQLAEYEKKFGYKFVALNQEKEGELIVLYEQGFVPMKEEVSIPFPTGYGITTVAFPVYNDKQILVNPLQISSVNRKKIGQTDVICDVQAMAYKALREKVALTAMKTVLRVVGKVALQRQAVKEMGELGKILSTLWNIISERADTRSWATLPANAQVFRTHMTVGKHRILFGMHKEVVISIEKGRKTLVLVNTMGSYTTVQSVVL